MLSWKKGVPDKKFIKHIQEMRKCKYVNYYEPVTGQVLYETATIE
jgi:hypothetical protein